MELIIKNQGCSRAMAGPAGRVRRSSKSHELGRFGSGRVRSGGVRNRAGWVGLGQDALKM